ncbi:DUF4983 domain-containing protein [Mucilaginibacter myungsuensis]|uniref:DUF4983 domain-containing protein n=1 Tax=Mucilaginibacter myungsuensis TaxID=649104 RepID=A0A929L1X3_9SPHI|nr:DUF4983 domain-containing protein [Mucilaginibacter myungsuensis]MBE9664633.1 DUF4983 domain-containing protein [Mucilaginibacter myungsuensis]MDN3601476.1 DUF4983 domain-containing protein [Mucilaginibacter myungsuensis]
MKNFKAKLLGVCVFAIALSTACNRGFDKVVPNSPPNPTISYKVPKVLYIIADGARGTSVRDGATPVIKSLLPNAIYSWNGLSDGNGTNATTWADMITGVSKDKHNVLSEDFAGNRLNDFPSIFERIKSIRNQMRIAAFSSSASFKDKLTGGTDVSESFATDAEVKTRMVDFLKADTASIIVGEFKGIQTAGLASGFDNSFPAYAAAITTFDTQVGEILDALKKRPTYDNENWMVIIASNKGGAYTLPANQDDKTVFSVAANNTFTIIYNPAFKTTFVAKPFVGNIYAGRAPRFLGDPQKAVATTSTAPIPGATNGANESDIFNFGTTRSFTISVKVKKHRNPSNVSRGEYFYEWSGFLGKRGAQGTPGTPFTGWGDRAEAGAGWDFCLFQNRWRFLYGGNTTQIEFNGKEPAGLEFSGDTWHDLTAVVEVKADNRKYLRLYTDGVMAFTNYNGSIANPSRVEYAMPGLPNFDNKSALRMGYTPGEINGSLGKIDVEIKELKIFNVALPDAVVTQFACDQTIDASHPYYSQLLGYWPCNEGSGNRLRDVTGGFGGGMDMTLAGGYTWESFSNDLMCSPPSVNFALQVPKNTDIPVQILSWLNLARQASWGLTGKVWIAN